MKQLSSIGQRYQILTEIGSGGMSTVYLVLDTVLNKQWAAKEIKDIADPVLRELTIQSIVTEANMIKSFDHPAIPRIVDLVDDDGTLYVIMDYVEGRTLADILALEGTQSEREVVKWSLQLCDVLNYLHRRTPAVVHQDIKPSNIMLKPDGRVQIIDFGIAHECDSASNRATDKTGTLTGGANTLSVGTRGYAAPEQHDSAKQTTPCSDIFSLGATMYTMLTGKNLADPSCKMLPIRQINPKFSPGLERIITKATQANPNDRFKDCAQMAYALAHYQEEDSGRREELARVWHRFIGLVATAVACLVIGISGLIGRAIAINSSYEHWMQIARQNPETKEGIEAYLKAADIKPSATEPYEGLIDSYRADGLFTTEEEEQLRGSILPHLDELHTSKDYAGLALKLGKLYWYNYAGNGSQESATRSEKIRAAAQWMRDAASASDFDQHDLAQAYADIADFETQIVPLINEGSDEGMYAPYYDTLTFLVDNISKEQNDVMSLQTANLVLDVLSTYPRKFRADGVKQKDLIALEERAEELARNVYPTTDLLDAEQERVLDYASSVRQTIKDAYIDVEA